jgi:hypothetical protein
MAGFDGLDGRIQWLDVFEGRTDRMDGMEWMDRWKG